MPGHLGDLIHEGIAIEFAALHLRELELPLAGELGHRELGHAQTPQQREQLEGLGSGDEVAAFPDQVVLVDQTFDHLRSGSRRAKSLGAHGLAQIFVVDQLARAFHGRQQRGLVEACRGPGRQRDRVDGLSGDFFVGLDCDQCAAGRCIVGILALRGLRFGGLAAVDRQPAGAHQNPAFGLE